MNRKYRIETSLRTQYINTEGMSLVDEFEDFYPNRILGSYQTDSGIIYVIERPSNSSHILIISTKNDFLYTHKENNTMETDRLLINTRMPVYSSYDNSGCWIIAIVVIVCLSILGLGISVGVISQLDNKLINGDNICPQFPNVTSFSMTKQLLSQWHWDYKINEFSGYARMKCPSVEYDSMLFLNGDLAAYIDGKILTVISTSYIMIVLVKVCI